MADNNMTRRELTPDILVCNILPRLPAESVGRFRCVSKEWHSFLTTLDFVKTQLLHQNQKYYDDQKLLLLSTKSPYTFRTIDCETHTTKDGLSASRPLPFKGVFMSIVASLHGLVCIQRGCFHDEGRELNDLILWNPLTNDYKTLSKPNSHGDYLNINYEGQFGLYYSTSDDDYKLLCVTNHTNPNPMVYIYSLKSDSWRKVETTNMTASECVYSDFAVPSLLLNEKLYFLKQKHINGEYIIMMFDTKTEKLREMVTPILSKEWTECIGFIVVRGSVHLSVAFLDSRGEYQTTELWRMNGSDGDGNWTKLVTYTCPSLCKKMHIMRNEDWLMYYKCDQGYVSQLHVNKHTYDIVCELNSMEMDLGWKYMESLVSPNQYIN